MVANETKTSLAGSIDLDACIERLYNRELLADSVVEAICAKAKELLMRESNVVHIAAPVTVVGDIHGQFYDMIEIFKIGGFCPDTNYLFLGRDLGCLFPAVIPFVSSSFVLRGRVLTADSKLQLIQAITSIEASSVLKRFPFLYV